MIYRYYKSGSQDSKYIDQNSMACWANTKQTRCHKKHKKKKTTVRFGTCTENVELSRWGHVKSPLSQRSWRRLRSRLLAFAKNALTGQGSFSTNPKTAGAITLTVQARSSININQPCFELLSEHLSIFCIVVWCCMYHVVSLCLI